MTLRVRTGHGFRVSAGKPEEVFSRVMELGMGFAPITDRASTFGWAGWCKMCDKAGVPPVLGVELAVTREPSASKPGVDHWTFIADDETEPVNRLVAMATAQARREPLLTLQQALAADCFKIAGSHVPDDAGEWENDGRIAVGLSPSLMKSRLRVAREAGLPFVAVSDNAYPREGDSGLYETVTGRGASLQTWPRHILSREEWEAACPHATDQELAEAWGNTIIAGQGAMGRLVPGMLPEPANKTPLDELCKQGAAKLGIDLSVPAYKDRLARELAIIGEKKFEPYFQIVADLVSWARERMTVGPARGSSCGSLACYLTGITMVDPLPHGLIFERFIDINRHDLPDIDIDFSDQQRPMVFDRLRQLYGHDRVAKLGTVAFYRPASAIKETCGSLGIPAWKGEKAISGLVEHAPGDERADKCLEDTFKATKEGRAFIEAYPEARVCERMEGHPRHHGQHAAGIVLTRDPIARHVATDSRTGGTHCDMRSAEGMGLLKLDVLGLSQLSIFEDALDMAGLPHDHLDKLPLDDEKAFQVLSEGKFSGIFQFSGGSLAGLARQVSVGGFEDIVALTALARPGPMRSGAAAEWIARKNGGKKVSYSHPAFEKHLARTLGVLVYQEQIMWISREVCGMDWKDVTALRKVIGKSQGKEALDKFGQKWRAGAIENGVPEDIAEREWDGLCEHGSYGFNRCIAADTPVWLASFNSKVGTARPTVEQLYETYVENASSWMRANGSMPTLWSLGEDGKSVKQKATRIMKSGVKPVNRYAFDDGTRVDCTADHRFLVDGEWKRAGDAEIGSEWTFLETPPGKAYEKNGRGRGHAKGRKWRIGHGNDREGDRNISWVNGVRRHVDLFREKMEGTPCEGCGGGQGRMEIHHEDFNSGKDRPDDLAWLCVSCHKKRHYDNGRTRKDQKSKLVKARRLVSVTPMGEKMTYDIEMPEVHNFCLGDGLVTHNSHSVAYGIVSYQCAWLKAHWPLEFAAATLNHEDDPEKQIAILRELDAEGVGYVPVDKDESTDKWAIRTKDGKRELCGPVTGVVGLGPKMASLVIESRATGSPLPDRARKLLESGKTNIDSLWPVRDRLASIMPEPATRNITSRITPIGSIREDDDWQEVVVVVVVDSMIQRDENSELNLEKREGKRKQGPTAYLSLSFHDDTGQMQAKMGAWQFPEHGKPMLDRGREGKALYALKGSIIPGSRFMMVKMARFIGDMELESPLDGK